MPVTIWATLPGYHYTDPHLPSWLFFDSNTFTFTGTPPVTSTSYNFTLNIVGVDSFANTVNTTFTIFVYKNTPCTAKYTNLTTNCTVGVFCSITILKDHFTEPNDERLYFSLDKITSNSWSKWSDLNATVFGVPASSGNITALVRATDEAGLFCTSQVVIMIKESTGKWPERMGIVAAVVGVLVILFLLLHCVFLNPSLNVFKKFKMNQKLEAIQHRINMKRYKNTAREEVKQTHNESTSKMKKSVIDWDKQVLQVDKDLMM